MDEMENPMTGTEFRSMVLCFLKVHHIDTDKIKDVTMESQIIAMRELGLIKQKNNSTVLNVSVYAYDPTFKGLFYIFLRRKIYGPAIL